MAAKSQFAIMVALGIREGGHWLRECRGKSPEGQ